ncbi:unnamed protein product [marine sediment metagenome]|uniref:Uncharacterized protein n=1 Tax=marine sediment metagenome TaxID=412755 RepID=X1QDU8_9ZZZZ
MAKATTAVANPKKRSGNPGNPGNPRRRRSRNRGIRIPLELVIPMGYVASEAWTTRQRRGTKAMFSELMLWTTGVDIRPATPAFTTYYFRYGLYPLLAGALVHKGANWLGINRALSRAGVPVFRI